MFDKKSQNDQAWSSRVVSPLQAVLVDQGMQQNPESATMSPDRESQAGTWEMYTS